MDLREVKDDKPIVVVCQTGKRSAMATTILRQAGLKQIANLSGGMVHWRVFIEVETGNVLYLRAFLVGARGFVFVHDPVTAAVNGPMPTAANAELNQLSTLTTLPGIKLSRTVGVAHATLGEIVVACIVLQEGAALDENSVREFLKDRLASYKVPRRVLFLRDHGRNHSRQNISRAAGRHSWIPRSVHPGFAIRLHHKRSVTFQHDDQIMLACKLACYAEAVFLNFGRRTAR